MKIMSPSGKVLKVERIVPYAEAVVQLNGNENYYTEEAKDLSVNPTGLKFYIEKPFGMCQDPYVYIGNLSQEMREEIQQAMLKEGAYNLSSFAYQEVSYGCFGVTSAPVIDGGISLPYYFESGLNFTMPLGCNVIPNVSAPSVDEKTEDESESDDESPCQ